MSWVSEPTKDLQIRVGSCSFNEGGKLYRVSRTFIHPNYVKTKNDLAMIELRDSVDLEMIAKPVPGILGKKDQLWSDAILIVRKKNYYVEGEKKEYKKKEFRRFDLLVLSWAECKKLLDDKYELSYDQICTTAPNSTESHCASFSGAPLVNHQHRQVGIFLEYSLQNRCNEKPVIYTSVAYHHDWINKIIYNERQTVKDSGASGGVIKNYFLFILIVMAIL